MVEEALQEHGRRRHMQILVLCKEGHDCSLGELALRSRQDNMKEKKKTAVRVQLKKVWCQNKVRTSLLPLALIRGKVALVSVLIGCEPSGVFPPFFLNRKSTLEDVMA